MMNEQEKEFLDLFRKLPPDEREVYLQGLRAEVANNLLNAQKKEEQENENQG